MSNLALERFRLEFRYWVTSHNKTHNFRTEPEELPKKIEAQIPTETLSQIGSAYINGWLMNETEPNRSYFVRETDRPGSRGGQFTLIHRGYGTVEPCWELYIQLADYAWLRTVAERYGLHVRLEDGLMDLTVRTSDSLVLYVEHKLTEEKVVVRVPSALTNSAVEGDLRYERFGSVGPRPAAARAHRMHSISGVPRRDPVRCRTCRFGRLRDGCILNRARKPKWKSRKEPPRPGG